MNKSSELKNTAKIVKSVLESIPEARNSDNYLYLKVCERINGIMLNAPFHQILLKGKEYGYPCFETVRRSRQKIQHDHPELSGNCEVEAQRILNEETFREYARS